MGIPIAVEQRFDVFSLVKYVKNTGRAYQRQAIELVNICRILVEKSPIGGRHAALFKLAMLAVVEALRSATKAGKTMTSEASNAFQETKEKLLRYRAAVHPRFQAMDAMIVERMSRAKEQDERLLRLFDQLRERRGPTILEPSLRKPTIELTFVLFKSPSDPKPVTVRQTLPENPKRSEVLWNFSRYKDSRRITLRQNPQFYLRPPASPGAHGATFSTSPLKSFTVKPNEMIYVLVDKQAPGHVVLEDGEGKPTRAFGNVWKPDDVMIFNGVRATSVSKELVRKEIHGLPDLSWCSECQGPGSRVQVPGVLDWKLIIRETSKMPSASVRIRAGHADRRVAVEAQVVCSNTNQDSPQTRTDQESLPSPKRSTPDPGLTAAAATTTTTTPLLPMPVAPGPAETRGTPPPTTVQEPGQSLPRYPRDFQQHPPVLSSPQPPSFLNRTDPPPNQIGVAPMTNPRCESGTSQHPHTQPTPNPLPRSEENKVPPTRSQAKITRSTLSNLSPKPSATIAPCPLKTPQSPIRLTMPGAFPGTSLDVDVSSWVLVSPGGPVEAPKTGWFKRIISRFA